MIDLVSNESRAIICVDDEKTILNTLYLQISEAFPKHIVEVAESGEEALALMQSLEGEGCTIELIISDQIMPSMKGNELLAKIFDHNNEIISVLLTGQASTESTMSAIKNSNLFRYLTKPWEPHDLMLCIDRALRHRELARKIKMQIHTFKKFVPTEFLTTLDLDFNNPESLQPGVFKIVENSILFLDLRDFTSISERIPSEKLADKLVSLFAYFEQDIREHNGFIDKYLGDAIMAIFPDPNDAIQSALQLIESLKAFNTEQDIHWSMGIGINTGKASMIMLGSDHRLDSTVIGDTVNIASRLEASTRIYSKQIIISDSTFQALSSKHKALFTELGQVPIKGKIDALLAHGYGDLGIKQLPL